MHLEPLLHNVLCTVTALHMHYVFVTFSMRSMNLNKVFQKGVKRDIYLARPREHLAVAKNL